MKKLIVFVLLVCMLTPTVAQAEWMIEDEKADANVSFTLDEPIAGKPALGGGYFLGDGPTIIKPERLTGTTLTEPMPTVTPEPIATPTPEAEEPNIPAQMIQGDYAAGSVYGPRLTAKELEKVRDAVEAALKSCIREGMRDKEKIIALIDYLCDACVYADSYKDSANNAYGALIEGKAQCSGYARAFKALCDGAGIGCYYVHAASDDPINPSHQWCLIEYGGQWYHIDPQMIDDYIRIVNGKVIYPRPITLMASHLTYNQGGLPDTAEKDMVLR